MSVARCTVDRFEGDRAVLEDEQGRTFIVSRDWLPAEAGEGAVLAVSVTAGGGESALRFAVDRAAHDRGLEEAKRLRDALPRGPGGDFSL